MLRQADLFHKLWNRQTFVSNWFLANVHLSLLIVQFAVMSWSMYVAIVILTERKTYSKSFDRHCGDIKDYDHSILKMIITLALISKIEIENIWKIGKEKEKEKWLNLTILKLKFIFILAFFLNWYVFLFIEEKASLRKFKVFFHPIHWLTLLFNGYKWESSYKCFILNILNQNKGSICDTFFLRFTKFLPYKSDAKTNSKHQK